MSTGYSPEHFLSGMGVRPGDGYRTGLWSVGTADGANLTDLSLYDGGCTSVLSFLHTRLVYQAQEPLGVTAKVGIRTVLASFLFIGRCKADGRIEDVVADAFKVLHIRF